MFTDLSLARKYNLPVPRYTSYPTLPFWDTHIDTQRWEEAVTRQLGPQTDKEGISLYIHLPFCESLCTYCGCNKKITTRHSVEMPYIEALLKEWNKYRALMDAPPLIREIHLGGGTPTFFSPRNLTTLIQGILRQSRIHPQHAFSVEGHPNNTTAAHLEALAALGFRRISYGVQDTNIEVQRIINRIQPFEQVRQSVDLAREAGFTSVNLDLIYGLPRQTISRLEYSLRQSLSLRPDRVAFYSYAHTPGTVCAQRLIDEHDLPSPEEKLSLYYKGREIFHEHGYTDIGMDHFALPTDELYTAMLDGSLQRNFMGYTTRKGAILIGLGVSAISDVNVAFTQNDKTLAGYYRHIDQDQWPQVKGCFLTGEDQAFRGYILDIACRGRVTPDPKWNDVLDEYTWPHLQTLQRDGLVELHDGSVEVTPAGRHLVRHICKAFDLRLLRQEAGRQPAGNPSLCGKSTHPYAFSKGI